MSAFKPHGALISIGGAILRTIGLSPQRVSSTSESRIPGHAVQTGMDYQLTGIGEQTLIIEARTWPHVTGGMDAFAILNAHHEMQAVVPYLRLRSNYLALSSGDVIIQTLEVDEEQLHPFDGVGRVIDVSIGLLRIPVASSRRFGGLI